LLLSGAKVSTNRRAIVKLMLTNLLQILKV
jgi:hypothetical protein